MGEQSTVETLLEDRPEFETGLSEVLAVDETTDGWTFDDVDLDSGTFGELVARGVVEETDVGYRLVNPGAVRAALDDEAPDPVTGGSGGESRDVILGDVRARVCEMADPAAVGPVVAVLLSVAVARTLVYPSVFRGGTVVLSSNDPYFYRNMVEQTLDSGGVLFIPEAAASGEPLFVVAMSVAAATLGGDAVAAGLVLAWYPVVAAVAAGALLYLLAVRVTRDRRVALAAVLMLAVTPGHAMRTGLGFGDHHAFDYVWLVLTAYGLVLSESTRPGERTVEPGKWSIPFDHRHASAAGVLALGITGQVLAWSAGPLLTFPVVVYAAVQSYHALRTDASPLRAGAPVLVGLAASAVVVLAVHATLGWQSTTVALAPAVLFVGSCGVFGVGVLVRRLDVPAPAALLAQTVGAFAAVGLVRLGFPDLWAAFLDGVGRIVAERPIAETRALVTGDALDWLLLFGFVLVLAVPALCWATVRAVRGLPEWTAPSVYGWYFLFLAAFQVRFVGELAAFTALFAGLAFVHLAAAVDVADPPAPLDTATPAVRSLSVPDRETAVSLVLLFVLVGGLGVVQVPVKTSQVTTDADAYRTAAWVADDAADRGLSYPENYVFSQWGSNRMYNYFVNGQSESYAFAQSNYAAFAGATNGSAWYERLRDRAGYVVVADGDARFGPTTLHRRLSDSFGSRSGDVPGLGHYRAGYVADGGAPVAFELVPGVRVVGTASPNATVTVATNVTVSGASFRYERRARADTAGEYAVTVAYPGRYRVSGATVTVSEQAVRNGSAVRVNGTAREAGSSAE